ncbi:fatty acyl-CoA reductase 2, chloroplastic-like [Benincasa hispida]|uniref:fatty acyl-CoA reductase 2, chloroplastic-like n=1 Tax=Benincasa hispida TaxID=102211 RepID=UPI001900EBF2|nr:fatty acyl-CoA reductase 2, chloroplastic-like [Benincasa hispida]
METLNLKPFSIMPTRTYSQRFLWTSKSTRVAACNGALKPSISNERVSSSSVVVRAAESGVLAPPNGKSDEIDVKSLVPYGGLVDMDEDGGIGIVKFLRGKVFFITGATGFLAKVLIEKMLRTAPDVGKIFVLIKAKDEEAAAERLKNDIINAELFKCLRQSHGKYYMSFMMSKLIPVAGNVCESDVGLHVDFAHLIANEVDVIVNSAANTTFDERYDVAIDINTKGPSNLMGFAKKCSKLKLFLQVSTAYVNGQRQGRIMERPFCNEALDVESEIKLAFDTKQAFQDNAITQNMKELGLQRAKRFGWQDTYVFTKAMGEMVIDQMRGEVPVAIIRPSVIESTFKDPFPGWMEGNRMMDPIVLYYGKGQLTGFFVDPNGVIDVVPADMVVNATLAAMARHGRAPRPSMNIYHVASSVVNPLVFHHLATLLHQHYDSSPCLDVDGTPIRVPSMKLFNSVDDFSDHLWRDAARRCALTTPDGKLSKKLEAICRKTVEQLKYLAHIYQPYTFFNGRFDNSNAQGLMEIMSEEEKREFGFDVESIDWTDYITNVHIPGLRRHVMKGKRGIN